MKHFGRYTLLLCLLLTFPAYASITINGETVSVETDGYAVQFDKGVITYIHNKHTDQTYTVSSIEGTTAWTGLLFDPDTRGDILTKWSDLISATQIDPYRVELLFHWEGTDIRLFIAVDPITDDLLINMEGESSTSSVVGMQWGLGALDIRNLSVIVPSHVDAALMLQLPLNTGTTPIPAVIGKHNWLLFRVNVVGFTSETQTIHSNLSGLSAIDRTTDLHLPSGHTIKPLSIRTPQPNRGCGDSIPTLAIGVCLRAYIGIGWNRRLNPDGYPIFRGLKILL